MKLRLVFIGIIFLQLISNKAIGQIAFTKNDTISIINDSLVLKLNEHRGEVSWQYSKDANQWTEIKNANGDSLLISKIDSSGFYRAKVVYSNCNPVFSDSTYVLRALPPLEGQKLKDDAGDLVKEVSFYSSESSNTTVTMLDSSKVNPVFEIVTKDIPDTIEPGWLLVDTTGIGRIILVEDITTSKSANGIIDKIIKGVQVPIDFLITDKELNYSSPTNRTKSEWDSPFKLESNVSDGDFFFKAEQGSVGITASVASKMLTLSFDNKTLWEYDNGKNKFSVTLEKGSIRLKPAIDFHVKYKPITVATRLISKSILLWSPAADYLVKGALENLKLIIYNDLDFNFKYKISASTEENLSDLIKPVKIAEYWYSIPAGPIVISVKTELIAQLTLEAKGEFSLNPEIEWNNNIILGIESQQNGQSYDKTPIWDYSNKKSITSSVEANLNLKERFEIVPKFEVYVMGLVGLSGKIIPYQQFTANASMSDNSPLIYDCSLDIGISANAGFDISAFHYDNLTATLFSRDFNLLLNKNIYSLPYGLEYISGNNQIGKVGQYLVNPLSVKVFDSRNTVLSNYPVFYDVVSGNGSLLSNFARSNSEGIAENQWQLGDADAQISKAYLKKANQSIIDRSVIEFLATKSEAETLPTLTTNPITSSTQTTATSGGNITSDGGVAVTTRGVCWSTTENPTIANSKTTDGNGTGSFTSSLTGLTANTTYYVRAFATNSGGTAYGNQLSFTTSANIEAGTVTDIDGNVYHTVTIGTQVWMVENLKTTKYNDGTSIPNVTDNTEWANLTSPGYCWYNNDVSYKNPNGALYNWYSINTKKLVPAGWHVASNAEWTELSNYVEATHGEKLKSINDWGALSNNTNSSGFTALPAGYRRYDGFFMSINVQGAWYKSDLVASNYICGFMLSNTGNDIGENCTSCTMGYSIRCIKD